MKRFAIVLISIIIISLSAVSVSAAGKVEFSVQGCEADVNRLVSLDVKCSSDVMLAAAIFDFSYDRSALEFRGVEKTEGVRIKYKENDDALKLIYYNYAEEPPAENTIFKLKFKTLKEGRYSVDYTVSQCVDNIPEDITVGNCTGGDVNVVKAASDSSSSSGSKSSDSSSKKDGKKNSGKSSGTGGSDVDNAEDETDTDEFTDNGEINDIVEKTWSNHVLMWLMILTGTAVILFTGVFIGKLISDKKGNKNDKN